MDPHLFDIIWEVYRESGSTQPIDVLSAYRSPQTNAMLRRRSRQVAEHSQHMQGKAIDAHFLDVSTARIRDVAMRMQEGGVGFYPTGHYPWVHIDSGSVRYWPKMSRDALTRLFPDGKTVFIPADGQPMPRYEEARAEIEARGGNIQVARGGGIGGLFSWLFGGGGADDAEELGGQEATTATAASMPARAAVAAAAVRRPSRRSRSPMSGRKRSPRRSATCRPAPPTPDPRPRRPRRPRPCSGGAPGAGSGASAPAPDPAPKPEVVAALEQPQVESDASARRRRSSSRGRSRRSISRPCRRGGRPISKSSSPCWPIFPFPPYVPPTSSQPSQSAVGSLAAGPASPPRPAARPAALGSPDATGSIGAPAAPARGCGRQRHGDCARPVGRRRRAVAERHHPGASRCRRQRPRWRWPNFPPRRSRTRTRCSSARPGSTAPLPPMPISQRRDGLRRGSGHASGEATTGFVARVARLFAVFRGPPEAERAARVATVADRAAKTRKRRERPLAPFSIFIAEALGCQARSIDHGPGARRGEIEEHEAEQHGPAPRN